MRADLTNFREPIERERNVIATRVTEKLRQGNLSKNELRALQSQIQPALQKDPGYPPIYQAYTEITDKLRDINIAADLDAVRIYMESENWKSGG